VTVAVRREGWPVALLVREAALNCGTRGSRLRTVPVLAIVAAFLTLGYATLDGVRFAEAARERESAGHYVLAFRSADVASPVEIAVASCERLAGDIRVQRAGVLVGGELVTVPQLGADQRVIHASQGLFPELTRHPGLLGAASPEVGGTLVVDGAPITVSRLRPQPRGVDVNRSVVLPLTEVRPWHDECLVVANRLVAVSELAADLTAALDVRGGSVVASGAGMDAGDLAVEFAGRSERWLSLVVGGAGGLLAAMVNRFRASEIAVYLLAGTSRADLMRLLVIEQLVIAGLYLVTTSASMILLHEAYVAPVAQVLWGLTGAIAWFVVAVFASLPVALRNPVTRPRDD
jgi:hypothetical protein